MIAFSSGDWRFFWQESISAFTHFPSAWDSVLNTGFGTSGVGIMWLDSYLQLTASISTLLHIPWFWISFFFWILPPVVIAFIAAVFLFYKIIAPQKKFAFLSGVIYATNTYFILVFTGGQLGVAFAYSLIPFVFYRFYCSFENLNLQNSLLSGLALAMLMLFDPRFVLLFLAMVVLYWSVVSSKRKLFLKQLGYLFILPLGVTFFLHLYWILPLVLTPSNALPQNFTSTKEFVFFSFTDFSHAFGLLHPNWPENIFGKVSFMKGEFLILPLLAFSSLLFVTAKKSKTIMPQRIILYFALLGLIGAFLAKGANDPFKQINIFLFDYFPAMSLFRDSTKFYIFIALSYAMLIPAALLYGANLLQKRYKKIVSLIHFSFVGVFLAFWISLVIVSSQGGIITKFSPKVVPEEYQKLRDVLASDKDFSRTLWFPAVQRYGYFSSSHPAMGIKELEKVTDKDIQKKLSSPKSQKILQDMGIRYVIIPFDSEKEFFLKNNAYSETTREKLVAKLRHIPWLEPVYPFQKMDVFMLKNVKDHFWSSRGTNNVNYQQESPTRFIVTVKDAKKGERIVFSEHYDPQWQIKTMDGKELVNSKHEGLFTSVVLPQSGDYTLTFSYTAQSYAMIGSFISGIFLLLLISTLIYLRRKK